MLTSKHTAGTRFPLLCIDTAGKRVTRYVRNPHGKVWDTHRATLTEVSAAITPELEAFRRNPEAFELQPPTPPEAA